MKIYITTIFPSSLKNKLTNMNKYLVNSLTKYELVSEEHGIHIIENDTIYRMEPNFNPDTKLIKNFININTELLIDSTDYKMIPVTSQLPVNYILTKMTIYEYQIDKKSNLKMIVECLNEPVSQNVFFSQNKQMDTTTIPINFYFIYNEKKIDLSDRFLKEEFNVFLSHLN